MGVIKFNTDEEPPVQVSTEGLRLYWAIVAPLTSAFLLSWAFWGSSQSILRHGKHAWQRQHPRGEKTLESQDRVGSSLFRRRIWGGRRESDHLELGRM